MNRFREPDTDRFPARCGVCRLGRIEYSRALALQTRLVEQRALDLQGDRLLLLEHPPTYTLGLRGDPRHLLVPGEELRRRGVSFHRTDRGGDITYHGPGQLVGWPIIKLPEKRSSPLRYLRNLEAMLVDALAALGVEAHLKRGLTGVWVGEGKIAAIGVRVTSRRVTLHGFALNVDPDLDYFRHIVPCGIQGKAVTSLAALGAGDISMERATRQVIASFGRVFGYRMSHDDQGETLLKQGLVSDDNRA